MKLKESYDTHEEAFLRDIEEAARRGARDGAREGQPPRLLPSMFLAELLSRIFVPIVVVLALVFALNAALPSFGNLTNLLKREEPSETHDLVLEDEGIMGYTAADFSEAILGKEQQKKELTVYEQEISDVATLTDTGFANLKVFTKCQLITYHGTASYIVDLSQLSKRDITLDEDTCTVTLCIPHAKLKEDLTVPPENIEFGDVSRGLLAMGEIELTPKQSSDVQAEAIERMKEKLTESNAQELADRYAKLSVQELYQPIVRGMDRTYDLTVEFKE